MAMRGLGSGGGAYTFLGCWMFRPVTGSAHGPNHPTARPVNCEVFSHAWAEPSVYATGASLRRGPKRLTTVCMS